MSVLRVFAALAVLLASQALHADPCKLAIEANDRMQFNLRQITVPASCAEVELTLSHSGKMIAKVMGHDWVLAKESDVSAIVNGGLAAGFKHGYLPENDRRIIAATRIVGGGESDTVRFATQALQPGMRYAFFCISPGHATVMRGAFVFGAASLANNLGDSGSSQRPQPAAFSQPQYGPVRQRRRDDTAAGPPHAGASVVPRTPMRDFAA